MSLLLRLFSDASVKQKYLEVGREFYSIFTDLEALGASDDFETVLDNWLNWEEEYSRRGYQTAALSAFSGQLSEIKISDPNLKPIHHAKLFKEAYLHNFGSIDNLNQHLGNKWNEKMSKAEVLVTDYPPGGMITRATTYILLDGELTTYELSLKAKKSLSIGSKLTLDNVR